MPGDLTRVTLEHIGSLGYAVTAGCVEAVHEQTGELHRVRFDDDDRYRAACQLARFVGIDLTDG